MGETANSKAAELVKGVEEVASPPETYTRICEALDNPECSVGTIGEIVSQDSGLTSKLLKLANSAFFGFAKQVETVTRAVTLLGTEQVRDLALATGVMKMFKDIPEDTVDMRSFWMHSIGCGMLSRLIAIQSKRRDIDRYFVVGMLHDLGRMVLLSKVPSEMKTAIDMAKTEKCSLVRAERACFGFCHAEVAEALFEQWDLPVSLIEPVRFHHQPTGAKIYSAETQIVHLSDLLVHAMEIGGSGEFRVPELSGSCWKSLNIEPEDLEPLMLQTEQEVELITGALIQ